MRTIFKKNAIPLSLAIVSLTLILYLTIYAWQSVHKTFDRIDATYFPVLEKLSDVSFNISVIRTELLRYLHDYEPSTYRIRNTLTQISSDISRIEKTDFLPEEIRNLCRKTATEIDQYRRLTETIEACTVSGNNLCVAQLSNELVSKGTTLSYLSQNMKQRLTETIATQVNQSKDKLIVNTGIITTISLIILSALIGGILIWNRLLRVRINEQTIELQTRISALKAAKKELRESEERFRAAFDSAQDCVLIWDRQYNYLYANQAAIDHVGATPDQIIGKTIRNGHGHVPELMERWMSRIDHVFETAEALRVQDEQEIQGNQYITDSILSPICDSEGNVTSVCVVYRDISELKRTANALQIEKSFTEVALDSQQDTFFLLEPATGKAIRWNKAFTDITGYTDDEIAAMPAPEAYYSPEALEQASRFIQEVMTTGDGMIELELICKDGRKVPTEYNVSVIKDNEGQPKYIISVGRDITERRQAEAEKNKLESQLRQAAKIETIGTLAGGIAHDFNNILGIVIGNCELAIEDIPDWSPAQANLVEIKTAAMRARDVVRQLLSFSRKSEQEKRPTKINAIVNESVQLLRASIPTTIELRSTIPSDLGTIMADPTQIHQIIFNLCTNSAHAMDESGGILEVTVSEVELNDELSSQYHQADPGHYIQLTVSDTGCGIDPEIKDRIFDPYFTTKDIGKGSGIGLSVVYGIVKNLNGAISVYSEPNQGTTIKVLFPIIDMKPVNESEPSDERPHGNESILLIDDEEAIVKMGRQILERLGYIIETKTDPVEALELFRSDPYRFDLVITDMTMPQMTGDALVKELIKCRPDIPVILCTGFSEKINRENADDIGINKYLEKPLNKTEIALAIRSVLDKA